ncbi:MAG: hypothetical protein M3P06_18145 [Acidobacteriota bacterium]|nr:hypothetical protein [Acidobacteriota bacterium]
MRIDLSVYFVGVCTHVWWSDTQPQFTNRVVLVNGLEDTAIRDRTIRSHIATLRVAAKDVIRTGSLVRPREDGEILEWQLNGVRVDINSTGDDVDRVDSFHRCIPKLAQLTPDVGPPSKASVDDGDPTLASCIFDIRHGTLQGRATQLGAALALLQTETSGDPIVTMTSFITGEQETLHLHAGAEMTVSNLGATEVHDDLYDFYLHYKLADRMPETLGVPDGPRPTCISNTIGKTWPPGAGSVGPGCSNSAYP